MVDTAQIWDLWVPEVATQGLSFARGRLDATDVLFVHAAGAALTVEVRGDEGALIARRHPHAHGRHTDGAPAASRRHDHARGCVADRSGRWTPRHHGRG